MARFIPARSDRVHIIGGPGSGKSTFARRLGEHTGIPVVELDTIAIDPMSHHARSDDEHQAALTAILAQPRWITEGVWLDWTDNLFAAADTIVWLDSVPARMAAYRIFVRFVRSALTTARQQRGLHRFIRVRDYARHLRQLGSALQTSQHYFEHEPVATHQRSQVLTAHALQPYRQKVIHCRTAQATESAFAMLVRYSR